MRIFLSYRRADGAHAGRLSDTLAARLGARNVFQDVTDIAAGRDFLTVIREALDGCDAAVAMIGPGWLAASTPDGRPRLSEPDDLVRLELATALSRGLPVAPVLMGGAALPAAGNLPDDIRALAGRQAFVVRDDHWHQDVDALLSSLRGEPASPPAGERPRRRLLALVAAATVVVLVATVAWWHPWRGGSADDGSATVAASCPDPRGWRALPVASGPGATVTGDEGPFTFTVRAASWRRLGTGRWQVVVDTTMENGSHDAAYHGDWRYDGIVVGRRQFDQTCFEASRELLSPGTVGDGRTGYVVTCPPAGRIDLILGDDGTRLPVTDAVEPGDC